MNLDHAIQPSLLDPIEDDEWAARATAMIEHLAGTGVEFTAETVRRRVGDPPRGRENLMGACFRAASRRRLIETAGLSRSRRITRRGGLVLAWRGRRAG
ncbi:MAG: hypothetical protein ACRDHU_06350 [Actinomycetota bacterium]